MKTAYLRPEHVTDAAGLHRELARQLGFPAWYGENLDALYDLLSEGPVQLVLCEPEELNKQLGVDFERFLRVARDAGARIVALRR